MPHITAALSNTKVDLFSDLLLHDLGSLNADGIAQGEATGNEFRTAPLWGLGKRIFFMHDGRANDLPSAIAAHRGEAATVVGNFNSLRDGSQARSLASARHGPPEGERDVLARGPAKAGRHVLNKAVAWSRRSRRKAFGAGRPRFRKMLRRPATRVGLGVPTRITGVEPEQRFSGRRCRFRSGRCAARRLAGEVRLKPDATY
jgi:Di-haem oxidoreductase, putative peroxidase